MLSVSRPSLIIVALIMLVTTGNVYNVTVVYNIKISQTTRRFQSAAPLPVDGEAHNTTATLTLVDQWRETYNHIKQKTAAGLITLLYSPDGWFARLESAVGYVKNSYPIPVNLIASRAQIDDIILSAGYGVLVYDRARVTASALLGIPTHCDLGLLGAQLGTGHVGLGVQLDAAYAYSPCKDHSLMGAVRYIRFLSRNTPACIKQEPACFNLTLGNLCDIVCATHSSWGRHQWEGGYNATFAFGAHSNAEEILAFKDQAQFMRSSFYTTYAYLFPIKQYMSGTSVGISYGFDHKPQCLGFQRMVSVWATWGIKF